VVFRALTYLITYVFDKYIRMRDQKKRLTLRNQFYVRSILWRRQQIQQFLTLTGQGIATATDPLYIAVS
jgi:hypothetical protein